jgi:hypothetical protein
VILIGSSAISTLCVKITVFSESLSGGIAKDTLDMENV